MSQPNPILPLLGLGPEDRAVVLHADDIGMCQASVSSFAELIESGLTLSASTMVPCPWFAQTAAFCRDHPGLDVGVHLTLNSEWSGCRWGPISTVDRASGMIDKEGYFHRRQSDLYAQARIADVEAELQAQLDRALAAGVEVTHIDTHMFALLYETLIPPYVQLAARHRLPLMFVRTDAARWERMGLDPATAEVAGRASREIEEQGVPIFDEVLVAPLDNAENRVETVKAMLDGLPAGLSQIIFHPTHDTPELRALAPDHECRIADHMALMSDEVREHIRASGIRLIGYRTLYDIMRRS